MPCFHPIEAWQLSTGEIVFSQKGTDGKVVHKEVRRQQMRSDKGMRRELLLKCGQCIGCKLQRSRNWAIRMMHESQMHEYSSFITLTFNEENCPYPPSLDVAPFQKFMKRLRHHFPNARYFMCGEYGSQFGRPHYHACLFGVHFYDRVEWSKSPSGEQLYRSDLLERLWPLGHSSIGSVTYESARYVANYCTKKITGSRAVEHYQWCDPYTGQIFDRSPEFATCSRDPAIGISWFLKYHREVFKSNGEAGVRIDGMSVAPPRAYELMLEKMEDFRSDEYAFQKHTAAREFTDDYTDDRLRVREIVTRARLSFSKRSLE